MSYNFYEDYKKLWEEQGRLEDKHSIKVLDRIINNPIKIEYYSHENCDCYKIDLPFTKYKNHKVVLCPVSEGEDKALILAQKVLIEHILESLRKPIKKETKWKTFGKYKNLIR